MSSKGKQPRAVGVALFGLGRAGQLHLPNLVTMRKAALKFLVEEDLGHGQALAEKHLIDGDVKVIKPEDAEQVFNDPGVDAIIVCTPTNAHQEIVKRGLKAGKAVFCEKPIALTIQETADCYGDAEKYGVPLLCAFNRRFDPNVRQLRERFRAGDIGQVQSVKSCSRDSPTVPLRFLKISGGIFIDCAVHDLDMICWILGEYPVSVFTEAHAFRDEVAGLDDVDQVMIVMKFASGCVACIDLNRDSAYGYDQRVEVFGSKGMLEQQNQYPTTVVKHIHSGIDSRRIEHSFPQRYREAYVNEMTHFLDLVLGIEKELLVKKDDTLRATLLASACEDSYRLNKRIYLEDYKVGDYQIGSGPRNGPLP